MNPSPEYLLLSSVHFLTFGMVNIRTIMYCITLIYEPAHPDGTWVSICTRILAVHHLV